MKRLPLLAAIAIAIGTMSVAAQAQRYDRRDDHRLSHRHYHRPVFHRPPPHFLRRDDRR